MAGVSPSAQANVFPTALFAALGDEPVPEALAAELREMLKRGRQRRRAHGDGYPTRGNLEGCDGARRGGSGDVPNDQMSIAQITETIVAAQVMQLVEAATLNLDDLASDHLPRSLAFDPNGASIADLLGYRSGFPDTLPGQWRSRPTTARLDA